MWINGGSKVLEGQDTPPWTGQKKEIFGFSWNCMFRSTCQWGSIWAINEAYWLLIYQYKCIFCHSHIDEMSLLTSDF